MKKIQGPLKGMIHDTQLPASDIVFNNIQLLNGTRIVCLHDLLQLCLGDLASLDPSNSCEVVKYMGIPCESSFFSSRFHDVQSSDVESLCEVEPSANLNYLGVSKRRRLRNSNGPFNQHICRHVNRVHVEQMHQF